METLCDIERCFATGLEDIPEAIRPQLSQLLAAVRSAIITSTDRRIFAPRPWMVDPDDVHIIYADRIGSGRFGDTYRAEWEGREVAVKIVPFVSTHAAASVFASAAELWSRLHHPNVLKLWRACVNADEPFLVQTLMRANLANYLAERPELGIAERFSFICCIARGMRYLHDQTTPTVHGDLQARNVMLGFEGEVCITGFGYSLLKDLANFMARRQATSVLWPAPERPGMSVSTHSDVFSFGMTCAEILVGGNPLPPEVQDGHVEAWIKQGGRPARPHGVPDFLWHIISACWSHNPAHRPSFAQIDDALQDGLEHVPFSIAPMEDVSSEAMSVPSNPSVGVDGDSDIAIVLRAFPDWASRKNVTMTNWKRYAGTTKAWEPSMRNWTDKPQLVWDENDAVTELRIVDGDVSGEIPLEIFKLTNLRVLDLHNNRLSGEIPAEIAKLTNLEFLALSWNSFSGSIPKELSELVHLRILFINNNQLTGELPRELSNLSELIELTAQENELSGTIPPEFGNLSKLRMLSLGKNRLFGQLPPELGRLQKLEFIVIEKNQFSGEIPREIGFMQSLKNFRVYENQLTGSIPPEIFQLPNLLQINVSSNRLSGEIPRDIGRLRSLQFLHLGENEFTGPIPREIGLLTDLQFLCLKGNRLTGQVPHELGNLTNLTELELQDNMLGGEIPSSLGRLRLLQHLRLQDNRLSGQIPADLAGLHSLVELHLNNNQLDGEIPRELGFLPNLTELYLFNNQLSGNIPWELGNLTQLVVLHLYNNQLSGPIPPEIGGLFNLTHL
nr:hypothetical protein HK105_000317 [Polyrhizophydium stewartii]